jgi:hypothetical protein
MANIHVLTNSHKEAVVKVYDTASAGNTRDINIASVIKRSDETFDRNLAEVTIKEIYWGAKKDKQIDISRIDDPVANTVHNHYYLINSGYYDYVGFVDNIYSNSDIRITSDGSFHVILKLGKVSGYTIG